MTMDSNQLNVSNKYKNMSTNKNSFDGFIKMGLMYIIPEMNRFMSLHRDTPIEKILNLRNVLNNIINMDITQEYRNASINTTTKEYDINNSEDYMKFIKITLNNIYETIIELKDKSKFLIDIKEAINEFIMSDQKESSDGSGSQSNIIFDIKGGIKELIITDESSPTATTNGSPPKTIYDFTAKDIDGNEVSLEKYRGFAVIVVNVASNGRFVRTTYKELNKLYDKFEDKGLRILAFPCNQFHNKDLYCDVDIKEFAKKNGVRYDFFAIVDVNGDNAHPLWKWLRQQQSGFFGDSIKWYFTKFLINRSGVPLNRYEPAISPAKIEPDLVTALNQTD